MAKEPNDQLRMPWAEICRSVSIFAVVLIHACGADFYQFGKIPRHEWLAVNALDSLVRCAVPLFVMLSGALILTKPDATNTKKVVQRVLRVVAPLVVWSVLYQLHVQKNGGPGVNLWRIFTAPSMYHLWFVYMIVGLYVLTPALKALFDQIHQRSGLAWYYFSIWLVVTSLTVYQPLPILSIIQQTSFFGYGGYFLLGALLARSTNVPMSNTFWALVFAAGAATTFGLTWSYSDVAGSAVEKAYVYFSPNVLVCSISAFVLFTRVRPSTRTVRYFTFVGNRSFFIFFAHIYFLEYLRYQPDFTKFLALMPSGVDTLLIASATFLLSLLVATSVRWIPGVRVALG